MPEQNPLLAQPLSEANEALLRAYARHLRAENKSPRTIQSYTEAARLLAAHAGTDLDQVTRGQIQDFLADQIANRSSASAAVRFRSLQQVYKWISMEGYMPVSPMVGLKGPRPTSKPVPVPPDDALARLVAACKGKEFADRRDEAIVRVLIDTGVRVSELTGVTTADLDMRLDQILVRGKGDRQRYVPFGAKTGQAIERYLRLRALHSLARLPDLWVGSRGKGMTPSGVTQMLERRCAMAGIPTLSPHKFRHAAASFAMAEGMGDDAIQRLFGWSSRDMLSRYGAAVADDRARVAHRRLAPGDRF